MLSRKVYVKKNIYFKKDEMWSNLSSIKNGIAIPMSNGEAKQLKPLNFSEQWMNSNYVENFSIIG